MQGVALAVIISLITVGAIAWYFDGADFTGFKDHKEKAFLSETFSIFDGSRRQLVKEIPLSGKRSVRPESSSVSLPSTRKVNVTAVPKNEAKPPLPNSEYCKQDKILGPLSRSVLINEVAWAGVSSDKTSDEWIELKNNTNNKINLRGWRLLNKSESINVVFESGDVIEAAGYYLLERSNDETVPNLAADKIYVGALKNSEESLRLFDENCNLVDEVVADPNWPAGSARPDYLTAERGKDFLWHNSQVSGTPRAENSSPIQVSEGNLGGQAPISPAPSSTVYYTIQFLKSGNGTGSVASDPAGINCGATCNEDSEDFANGTVIKISAVPASDSYFWGWTGACSGTENNCVLKINDNKNITAVFNSVSAPSSGNSSSPSASGPLRSNKNHILISQVQITGGAGQTTSDFIEIYNPTGEQFNLKGYRLVKRTHTGTSDTSIKSWTTDVFIPPYGFYLWANSAYTSIARTPDAVTTGSIADNNGIALRFGPEDAGEIIDAVAWGDFRNVLFEGTAVSTPGANQSIIRKTWNGNCITASLDKAAGNGCDTGNNAQDFEILENPLPRNTQY